MSCSRKDVGIACAILAFCGFLPAAALATQSVELFFNAHNGAPIAPAANLVVAPGDSIGVEMIMTTDAQGVWFYGVSVDFDSTQLGRLSLDAFANVLPPGFQLNLGAFGPDDSRGEEGFVSSFAAIGPYGAPNPLSENAQFLIATLSFTVTAGILDGPAIVVPGIFNTGVDEILSNENELIGNEYVFRDVSAEYVFQAATIRLVPEPSTALLLVVGLALLSRARSRL